MSNQDDYQYKILAAEHSEQTVNLISNAFCHHEPMTKYLHITSQEFKPFVNAIVKKAIKDKLSVAALHHEKVVACAIVEDASDPLDITSLHLNPKFNIIFSLLENLSSKFITPEIIEHYRIAHLFITAVDSDYAGHHLSRGVNLNASKLAERNHYDFMYCEFTHPYNEKGTVKYLKKDKALLSACQYKDYIFEGKKVFANLETGASSYIWALNNDVSVHEILEVETLA